MQRVRDDVSSLRGSEIVIGIPFSDELETLPEAIEIIDHGAKEFYADKRVVFILVGAFVGRGLRRRIGETLKARRREGYCFTLDREIDGKGWTIRALMEVSEFLNSDLIILEPDFVRKGKQGLQPCWIHSIYRPIELGNEFVLPVYRRPPEGKRVTDHLIVPLLISLYGYRVREPMGGVYGISKRCLHRFLRDKDLFAETDVGNYGIDIFLTITAIINELAICQANLGTRLKRSAPGEFPVRLRQALRTMCDQIGYTSSWWLKEGKRVNTEPPFYGRLPNIRPPKVDVNIADEVARYRMDFQRYKDYLYRKLCPPPLFEKLLNLSMEEEEEFSFSPADWSECVYALLLAYFFQKEIPTADILDTIVILNRARTASFIREVRRLTGDERQLKADRLREAQVREFTRLTESFEGNWRKGKLLYVAPMERVLLEFLPGVPLNLPKEVEDAEGEVIRVYRIFEDLQNEVQKRGSAFLPKGGKVEFMERSIQEADEKLRDVLKGNVYSLKGVRTLVENIFRVLPLSRKRCLFLDQRKIIEYLEGNIPHNFLEMFGYKTVTAAIKRYEPRDILILASFTEGRAFNERFWDWLGDAQPDWFRSREKGFLVRDHGNFGQWVHSRGEPSDIEMLCGKILVTQYPRAAGLAYPYLLYLSLIAKLNVEMEMFSQDWKFYAQDRDFSKKVVNSLRRHLSRDSLSAHEIFEAEVDETAIRRIGKSRTLRGRLGRLLDLYYIVYKLDGDFLSLGFPSWAIYRTWGRKGIPSKGFLGEKSRVEQRWFVREILLKLAEIEGLGDESSVRQKVREMRGNGIEDKNIAAELGLVPAVRFDRENLHLIFRVPPDFTDKKSLLRRVNVLIQSIPRELTLDDLVSRVPRELKPTEEQIEEVYRLAHGLRGLEVTHFNSARHGGGVAEILDWLVPLMNSVGIKAHRVVVGPKNPGKFFPITKTFHNALQGMEAVLTEEMKGIYLGESEYMKRRLSEEGSIRGDVLVCHDPQPLAAIASCSQRKVWRAHIDLSFPQREFVTFLLQFIERYDAAVFHFEDFILSELKGRVPIYLIPAGVNFLTPKNVELPPEFPSYILKSFGIERNRPIILQISRFDRFKDPKGVVEAFERARGELSKEGLDIQLVYAGNMAGDDPEGMNILSELIDDLGATRRMLRKRPCIPQSVVWTVGEVPAIFIVNLGATPVIENALVVNALQRAATIVLQKSLKEGLGLTILEAMCKGKPVIVGNVGGPAHLIEEDGAYGYGVGDRDEKGNLVYTSEETAGKILRCFEDPQKARLMSERAQRYVGVSYSAIRHLVDYLGLFDDIMHPSKSTKAPRSPG